MTIIANDSSNIARFLLVDSSGRLYVIDYPASSVYSGQKNVTIAGTQVVLGTSQAIRSITIIAKSTNTGNIYVGASSVDSSTGGILTPGDSISLDIDNVNLIYIDSAVDGEGVSWVAIG